MMSTDPDLQTIFHIYALMSLCFAHIRLYFEINRHTADYRLLTVCCEVLFMTNYVIGYKRMIATLFFWALQTTSLWGPREEDFEERTEYCTTTEEADGNERGK